MRWLYKLEEVALEICSSSSVLEANQDIILLDDRRSDGEDLKCTLLLASDG